MNESLITFRTAKLAKEKGFLNTEKYYSKNKNLPFYFSNNDLQLTHPLYNEKSDVLENINMPRIAITNGYISVSTQSLLQKWLREKHGLILLPVYTDIIGAKWGYTIYEGETVIYGNSYEEALEEGLYQALLLISKKEDNEK